MRNHSFRLIHALFVLTMATLAGVFLFGGGGLASFGVTPGQSAPEQQAIPQGTGTLSGPQPVAQRTAPERTEGTFVAARHVVIGDLPAAPAVARQVEAPIALPRRAPTLERAYGAQVATANALDRSAGFELQPMAAPDISTSFDGLDSTDNPFSLTPPDPQLAVGPSHVVEFINVVGRITDKSGVPVGSDFLLDTFFGTFPGSVSTDPKIIYDDIDDRFFATYIDFGAGFGDLFLAVSDSSDPTLGWTVYIASFLDIITDYEAIGLTSDKVTISSNLFDIVTLAYIGEQTLVLQKSDLLVADPTPDQFLFPIRPDRFTVRPAHHLSPGNDQYLTTFDITGGLPLPNITVIRITGTPEAGTVAEASAVNLPVIPQDIPPPSLTAGPGSIDSGDFRLLEAVWRDNSLWSSASAACLPPGDTIVRSCAHLIEVETVGTPSVVQDIMFGAPGQYYSWPAIRTDSSANLYVSFTGTHADMFASAQVAGRLASDPLNTMTGSCLLKAGEIVHLTTRWGDYLGAAVDPANPSTIWVVSQYAKNDGDIRWGTFIGSLSYTKPGACPQKQPPPTPPPPKGNDDFANAVAIPKPLPFTNAQDTTGSTVELGEPSPCGGIASTVWYRHTPTTNGTMIADTFGSSYDTVLAVYTGPDVGSLTLVDCNDDTIDLQSEVTFAASAGTTYHFQLGGFSGGTGSLVLNVVGPSCPDNDGDTLCDAADPDDDNDGLPDDYEAAHPCLDPLVDDAASDPDGDTLSNLTEFGLGTDPCEVDTDQDGCSDGEEMAPKSEAGFGGGRNPLYFWDFFDPTRNKAVGFTDFIALIARRGAVGDPTIDPLSDPPPPPAYHPRFDRGGQIPGGNLWEERPANGSIGFTDFLSLIRQNRATCLLPP